MNPPSPRLWRAGAERSRAAEALFSLALLAYPRAFRRRFGDEMRDDFRRIPRDTRGTLRTLRPLLWNGLKERGSAVARWAYFPNFTPHLYEPTGRHFMFWDTLRADIRHTLRQALQAPTYTALAVLALALGIGANSAIFTVVQGVLLKPLPYRDPGQLVMVWSHNTREDKPQNPISPANYVDLRDESRAFATVEGYFSFVTNTQVVVDGPPEMAVTSFVTPGLFGLLGRTALIGRALTEGDPAGHVVLSHGYWQRRFGADPLIVNRQITLDGQPALVVGVMPPDFVFPYKGMVGPTGFTRTMAVDAWTTMVLSGPRMTDTSGRFVRNVHYLAAGAALYGSKAAVGYQYPAKTYVQRWDHDAAGGAYSTPYPAAAGAKARCTYCHMEGGSHEFVPKLTATCVGCHTTATSWDDLTPAFRAEDNYDNDPATKPKAEFGVFQARLLAAIQKYMKAATDAGVANATYVVYDGTPFPYFFTDANKNGIREATETTGPKLDTKAYRATFNYNFSVKEPGSWAHNAKYILQVLYDSIEDLDPTAVAGLTRP